MKIAIVGSGSVGSCLGGMLTLTGNDVTFIARGDNLVALRERGLRLERPFAETPETRDQTIPVKATDDPAAVGLVDLVIFVVKAYDLETAATAAKPLIGANTVVLPLQNGIDHVDELVRILGGERVVAGPVEILVERLAPGHVLQRAPLVRITFGELDGSSSERAERIAATLRAAGVDANVTNDVKKALWTKLCMLAASSGVAGSTRLSTDLWSAHRATVELFRRTIGETIAVARADGANLDADLEERLMGRLKAVGSAGHRPSLLQDLDAGRPIEVEAIQGAVVRRGDRLGIPTPTVYSLYAILSAVASARKAPVPV